MNLTTKWLIGLGIMLLLLWNPYTRLIVLFVLPLGRGIDDLIFILVALLFVALAVYKSWVRIPFWGIISSYEETEAVIEKVNKITQKMKGRKR